VNTTRYYTTLSTRSPKAGSIKVRNTSLTVVGEATSYPTLMSPLTNG